jgi:hypothetical protein
MCLGRRRFIHDQRAAFDFKTKLDLLLADGDYTIGRPMLFKTASF